MSNPHAILIRVIAEKVIAPLIPDVTTRIMLSIENGQLMAFRNINEGEVIASLDVFLHYAKQAGWKVTPLEES